jgi:hypothetical protein
MQIEPTHVFPMALPVEDLKVAGIARAKHAKPSQTRSLTPLVIPPHAPVSASHDTTEQEEQRHDTHPGGERRIYCRRIEHFPVLIDLRFGFDRRRTNQRANDPTEHIDEVV